MLCNPRTPASVLRSQRNASLPAVDLSAPGGAEAAYDKVMVKLRARVRAGAGVSSGAEALTLTLTLTPTLTRCPSSCVGCAPSTRR